MLLKILLPGELTNTEIDAFLAGIIPCSVYAALLAALGVLLARRYYKQDIALAFGPAISAGAGAAGIVNAVVCAICAIHPQIIVKSPGLVGAYLITATIGLLVGGISAIVNAYKKPDEIQRDANNILQ